MFSKLVLLVVALGAVSCQVEQSIFAQLYYPPVALNAPRSQASTTEPPESPERLEVLPLLARARRSGFGSDAAREGNDAALARVRDRLHDPAWFPEIVQRLYRQQE